MAKIIDYYHLGWMDFDYIYQDTRPKVGTADYEKIKEEIIKSKSFDCASKMLEVYNRSLHLKSFSEMYERLTKKIDKMFEEFEDQKDNIGITAPGIDAAILVNSIAAKYGIFKVFAVKNDFRFKFPKDYISGNISDYEKLIGCSYQKLYEHNIYNICFFNNSIYLELDPAEQLRAGLIKRGF